MKFCPNCGNKINSNDCFCQFCGNQLKKAPGNRTLKTESFCVVGVCYYFDNLKKISCLNPDYKRKPQSGETGKIFHYQYINKPVKLISEPNNQHDKNAIMVIIAGELVGYVPADQCVHIRGVLTSREVKYLSAFISGGEYKFLNNGKIVFKDEDPISIKIKIGYV